MKLTPISNFPGYFITKSGEVYSTIPRYRQPKKIRKLSSWNNKGYPSIGLSRNGKKIKQYIHNLLLETFVSPRPSKDHQCRHLNGNPKDFRLKNLKWGTKTENQADRLLHKTDNRGEKHGMSRLTKSQVLEIRRLAKGSNTQHGKRKVDTGNGNYKAIAKKFGISPTTVGTIARKVAWNWLK